jgi:dihydropteroate synthase
MGVMSSVELVGILNVTPDSFSDGGLYVDASNASRHADELFQDGAALVDVGAESTRPNATPLTADEEWARLAELWPRLMERYTGKLSLDTRHPETVRRAAQYGPFIINDVTAFSNDEMIAAAAELRLRCIVSHLPEAVHGDIQAAHKGKLINNVLQVRDELMAKRDEMIARGIAKENIILDPGIGFGKTPETNYELLKFAALVPNIEVMIGYSRKRFLGDNRMELEPNITAGRIAANAGARYLRVHDVTVHRQAKI